MLVSGPDWNLDGRLPVRPSFPKNWYTRAYLAVGRLDCGWKSIESFRECILDAISAAESRVILMDLYLMAQGLQWWSGNGKDVDRLLRLRPPRYQWSAKRVCSSSYYGSIDGDGLSRVRQRIRDTAPLLVSTCFCRVCWEAVVWTAL